MADHVVALAVEHILKILRPSPEDTSPPPSSVCEFAPGLLAQLPCVTVSAQAAPGRKPGLGRTFEMEQAPAPPAPPGQPVSGTLDRGEAACDLQPCIVTLSLWAVTRPQLQELRAWILETDWTGQKDAVGARQRATREWEDPSGYRNRTIFLQCELRKISPSGTTPLPAAPPLVTVTSDSAVLRDGPAEGSAEIGTAGRGAQFELMGRSADSLWLQGAWGVNESVWIDAREADSAVPLSLVPESGTEIASPTGKIEVTAASKAAISVWKQDVEYAVAMELRRSPIKDATELISEIRLNRSLSVGELIANVERTRMTRDRVEVVQDYPPDEQ